VELYRGPFGADFYSDWLDADRRRLENMYIRALGRLAEYERAQGNPLEAISLYEKAVQLDPLNDSLSYSLIETYSEAGELEAAIRCYRRYAATVRNELAEEPPAALTELHNRLCSLLAGSR